MKNYTRYYNIEDIKCPICKSKITELDFLIEKEFEYWGFEEGSESIECKCDCCGNLIKTIIEVKIDCSYLTCVSDNNKNVQKNDNEDCEGQMMLFDIS